MAHLKSFAKRKNPEMNSIIQPMRSRSKIREEIRREVSQRYAEKKEERGCFQRFLVWLKVERETSKELKRRFPPQALYLAGSR